MNRPSSTPAFTAPSTPIVRTPACATAFCGARAGAPFFASSAFGTPIAPRAHVARSTSPRMDVTVVVGDNEPIESALRRFKKDVTKSGHLFELRRRRYFETNTEKRLRKAAAARRKARMARNMKNNRNRQQGARSATAAAIGAGAGKTEGEGQVKREPMPGTTPPTPRV